MQAKEFTINIPQADIEDLKQRLKNTRFPDEPQAVAAGWGSGTDVMYIKKLVEYWLHSYDWRKHEAQLNKLPHFKVTIDDTQLHFVHVRSKNPSAKPLLLTHGWPDTFYRFHKVIPELAKDYDVIVPSLPGFGFSERKALSSAAVADLWAKLMTKVLGYKSFLAAGGDLGSPVTKALAMNYASMVEAVHLTDVGYPTGQEDPATLTKAEKEFIDMAQWWSMTEGAYLFVQGNKPQSLAYGLNDSPVGLAAWIVSFVNGGNDKAVAEDAFGGRDELLTNIMIYWFTQTAGSAARMYQEEAKTTYGGDWNAAPTTPKTSTVPTAVALFPGDSQFPKEWALRQGLNVKRFTKLPRGGHFAALDSPEVFAKELKDAFTEIA